MTGWIKIHREIKEHWIFSDAERLKAWMIILLEVNFEDKTELIQGELLTCKRGQSLYSLDTWAKKFGKNWTVQKVRTFFNLLKKDQMITTEGLRKTTRLTVCKYGSYQNDQQTDNRQITDKQQTDNRQITTTKECKEIKEGKECKEVNINSEPKKRFSFKNALLKLGVNETNCDEWIKHRKNSKASNTERAFSILKSEIEKSKLSANECIEICLGYKLRTGKVWTGFKAEWVKNINKTTNTKQTSIPVSDYSTKSDDDNIF